LCHVFRWRSAVFWPLASG